MTSPRDESLERMTAAAKGIRKEWRVFYPTLAAEAGRDIARNMVSEAEARGWVADYQRTGLVIAEVQSRHVTPWQPDPGAEVAQREGEARQRTSAPATPEDPSTWPYGHDPIRLLREMCEEAGHTGYIVAIAVAWAIGHTITTAGGIDVTGGPS